RYGTGRLAGAAVDALIRVNVEHLVLVAVVVDAVHRANVDAGAVLRADARRGDYVRHFAVSFAFLSANDRIVESPDLWWKELRKVLLAKCDISRLPCSYRRKGHQPRFGAAFSGCGNSCSGAGSGAGGAVSSEAASSCGSRRRLSMIICSARSAVSSI